MSPNLSHDQNYRVLQGVGQAFVSEIGAVFPNCHQNVP